MGEEVEDQTGDVDMTNFEVAFDNLTILREIENIVNLVRNEDFLETVPKVKVNRVTWVPLFNYLKKSILEEILQELSNMWEYENMPQKLEILEKQKEKYEDISSETTLWRPQLGDVKSQLKASDVANLQKQKRSLESLAKHYESNVNRLKKTITAKRGYLKALQMDIQKYHKKCEDFITKSDEKIESHQNILKQLIPNRVDIKEIKFTDKDLEKKL